MNQKNSLGLNKCFLDLDDPFKLFEKWFDEAKKKEINDPNALALGTASKTGIPSVRMVLLKGFDNNGFVFYTNLNSQKGNELKDNPNATMCFHWKSLLRQIRIVGTLKLVDNKTADDYYNTRAYESRIGAWASKQSSVLKNREKFSKFGRDQFLGTPFSKTQRSFFEADLRTQKCYRYNDEKFKNFHTRVTGIIKFFGLWV